VASDLRETLGLVSAGEGAEMVKPRLPFCTNMVRAAVQNASSPKPGRCSLPGSVAFAAPTLYASV